MFDIAVIGAGSGGLSIAAAAVQFGRSVVMFEGGEMGGDCLNTGCVPSKALLAQAKLAQLRREAGDKLDPALNFSQARQHVHATIAAIEPHDSAERFEALGVTVVRHNARFTGANSLEAGGKTYVAKRIVIATGSRANVPPIPGLEQVPHDTNESIFEAPTLPQHLVVLGGGPIGMELAQAFCRLGSKVTVVEALQPLGREDSELSLPVIQQMQHEGVTILAQTKVTSVSGHEGAIRVDTDKHGTISASHLLVATGRKPNIESLNVAAAGIAFHERGVVVDGAMRTNCRHIYAIGDVTGGPQFTHAASLQASLVLRHMLFRLPGKFRPELLPRVTYCDPELAAVGLDEATARTKYGDSVRVYTSHFDHNDRAIAEGRIDGFVKIIATRRGSILGVGVVGAEAGLLLQPWVLAMERGLKLKAMAENVVAYPSRAEAGKRAAVASFAHLPQNRWVRYAVGIMNRLF